MRAGRIGRIKIHSSGEIGLSTRVIVDGHDLSDMVSAITIHWQPDDLTTAEITLKADSVEIDAPALAHIIALAKPTKAPDDE